MTTHTRAAHGPCVCSLKAKADGIEHTKCTSCRLVDECPYCTPTASTGVIGSEGPESSEEVERALGTIGNPVVVGAEPARRPSLPDVPLDPAFDLREHHWREGIYFARTPQGIVRIRQGNNILALIPPAEWCSIVAAVSKEGGEAHEYSIAHYLHLGGG